MITSKRCLILYPNPCPFQTTNYLIKRIKSCKFNPTSSIKIKLIKEIKNHVANQVMFKRCTSFANTLFLLWFAKKYIYSQAWPLGSKSNNWNIANLVLVEVASPSFVKSKLHNQDRHDIHIMMQSMRNYIPWRPRSKHQFLFKPKQQDTSSRISLIS